MRRVIFLVLMLFISIPVVTATDISSNEEHDGSGELSGNYTVKDGATWTVSGNYDVADDTSIVVDEGSTMIISGSMDANSPPQLNLDTTSSVVVPIGNLGPNGLLRIIFADQIVYDIAIEVDGASPVSWNGTVFDWVGNMDVGNITIHVSHGGWQVVGISEILLSPEDSTPESRSPSELSGEGVSVAIPDRTKAWSIDVQGTLIVEGSVYGAEISCSGTCTLDGAQMTSTSPIEVTGTISVTDSTFSHVRANEDILLWDNAIVTWISSNGTGGETDNWARVLTTRTMGVQSGNLVFSGYQIGYDSKNTSVLLADANNIIEIGDSDTNGKRDRMVSWQDGNGVEHTETASGKISLDTGWGLYEYEISDLPKVNHFDIGLDLEIPRLIFDSLVASDDENDVDSRLGVMATITNSGSAAAMNVLLDCTSDGKDANVGSTVLHTVEAGKTIEIPLNWDSPVEGDHVLECSIFTPEQFEGYEVLGPNSGTATTEIVSWSNAEDNSSNLIIPISIGIVVAIIIYMGVARMKLNQEMLKEHLTEIEEADEDDAETGTIE